MRLREHETSIDIGQTVGPGDDPTLAVGELGVNDMLSAETAYSDLIETQHGRGVIG